MSRILPLLLVFFGCVASAQLPVDSDHDGLSDVDEQALLTQFAPQFLVSRGDCSVLPARFAPALRVPTVVADDATIYGQASPQQGQALPQRDNADVAELHFYHLWRRDCGEMGHALDTEHVAALVRRDAAGEWRAVYWYAAAHEDTVCDASQITRAETIGAEKHGPRVWVSAGKHASYLDERLCRSGCGGDVCGDPQPLPEHAVVNLGEADSPSVDWVASPQWPLEQKMTRSDFLSARVDRLEHLPVTDVAWANPSKRPVQAAILGGNRGVGGTAVGLSAGGRATDTALVVTREKAGSAVGKSLQNTVRALGSAMRHTGKALGVSH